MRRINEIWREYPIEEDFEGFYRIEFSNHGNVKTYSKVFPEGNHIDGSLQFGYKILRSKLKRKWSEKDLEKIAEFNKEINRLNSQIKEKKNKKDYLEEVVDLREKRDQLIQKRKNTNARLTKKYSINLAILFHKAVAELFLDPPKTPEHKFIIHIDFDKLNNNVQNLKWATQEDLNKRTMKHPKMVLHEFKKQFVDKSLIVKTSKLSNLDVLTIKKRLKRGYTLHKLAKQFGVSDMQIHRIKTGENWSHVKLIEDILEEKEK